MVTWRVKPESCLISLTFLDIYFWPLSVRGPEVVSHTVTLPHGCGWFDQGVKLAHLEPVVCSVHTCSSTWVAGSSREREKQRRQQEDVNKNYAAWTRNKIPVPAERQTDKPVLIVLQFVVPIHCKLSCTFFLGFLRCSHRIPIIFSKSLASQVSFCSFRKKINQEIFL